MSRKISVRLPEQLVIDLEAAGEGSITEGIKRFAGQGEIPQHELVKAVRDLTAQVKKLTDEFTEYKDMKASGEIP